MRRFLASLRDSGVDESVRRVSELLDAGYERLVLEEPLYALTWNRLRSSLPRDSVHALRLFLPFPSSLRPPKRSTFRLGGVDPGERREATARGVETLEAADTLGARLVLVPPVELESENLPRGFVDPTTGFLGDEAEDEARAREARRAEAERRLDSFMSSLSTLLDRGDRYGLRLAIIPSNRPAELPHLDEAQRLFDEFRGAPLLLWLDTARWPREFVDVPTIGQAADLSGHGVPFDRVAGVSIRESRDGVDGFLPGRGGIDWTLFASSLLRHEAWCTDLRFGAPADEYRETLEWLRNFDAASRQASDGAAGSAFGLPEL